MMRKTLLTVCALAAAAGATLSGCSREPPLPDGPALLAYAEAARDDAAAAWAARDAKAARRASDRAQAARVKADQAAAAAPPAEQDVAQALARQVRAAAREADKSADLAEEDKRLGDKVNSWKAKCYRAARGLALKAVYTALALAAEHAAGAGYDALSPEHKQYADVALAAAGDPRLESGEPDWKAVAANLSAWADEPPPEHACLLAAAFAAMGRWELALYEAERIDAAAAGDARGKMACAALRGVVYGLNDFPRLATREFEALAGPEGAAASDEWGPQLQAGICLFVAMVAASERNFEEADRQIMRATRLWPNNPIGVVLTGEVMVAEGEYEKAAVTLEDLLRQEGAEADPWLVEHVQKRARRIRDGTGDVEPLLHDPAFRRDVALHFLWEAARSSRPAARLKAYVDSARSFGAECLKHLPDLGGKPAS